MNATPNILPLLDRAYTTTGELFATVADRGWEATSACPQWSVRQVGNHLIGGFLVIARLVEGETIEPYEFDGQYRADTDHLRGDPVKSYLAATQRSMAAFSAPGALDRDYPFTIGPFSGQMLASVSMQEALTHGWDMSQGTGLPYHPDPEITTATWEFVQVAVGDQLRDMGMFGPPVPTALDATSMVKCLGHLGRAA
jgi:uncharacterized protein (TIGR03086 family)